MTLRTAVFASGGGSNFQVLVDASRRTPASGGADAGPTPAGGSWEVVLLVTDREGAGVMDRAQEMGIRSAVVPPDDPREAFGDRLLALLGEARVDVVLLAGYLRLIPPAVVRRFRGRMLNLHPALLPGFGGRGMYGQRVHQAVLDSGTRISGATVHLVDEEYDRGPILAQWPVPVLSGDTPESLQARVQEVEHLLYPAAVESLARALAGGDPPSAIPASGPHFHMSPRLPEIS